MATEPSPTNYLDQASHLLNLPIRPEHRDEVLAAFQVLLAQANLIIEFELPETFDPAPRFTP